MIAIRELDKSYGKRQVLRHVNLNAGEGRVMAITGPNGSGKSTLIKCLLGLIHFEKGTILIRGKSAAESVEYRKDIGYMPQISRFPDNMKTAHLFNMMRDIRKSVLSADNELYEAFHLNEINDQRLGVLSGGTRQKVSAVLAFMFNPSILILDEPTASLDPFATEILKDKIIKAKESGRCILITSHNMNEVEELADDVCYMEDGISRFCLSTDQLKIQTGEVKISKAVTRMILNLR